MCEASPPISTLPSQMEAGKSLSHLIKEREAEERGKEGKRGMESERERQSGGVSNLPLCGLSKAR